MFKINATTRLKLSAGHEDHSGEELFADVDPVIAPSDSYKDKNEKKLEQQQSQRESNENKESTSDGTSKEGTAVHDTSASLKASKRLSASLKKR